MSSYLNHHRILIPTVGRVNSVGAKAKREEKGRKKENILKNMWLFILLLYSCIKSKELFSILEEGKWKMLKHFFNFFSIIPSCCSIALCFAIVSLYMLQHENFSFKFFFFSLLPLPLFLSLSLSPTPLLS